MSTVAPYVQEPCMSAGGGVLAMAAVVRDSRVTLRGRACAAGCLKLYMARSPQELIAAGVVTDPATVAGVVSGAGPAPGLQATGPGVDQAAAGLASAPGPPQTAAGMTQTLAASAGLGATLGGLSAISPGPAAAAPKKPKPPFGKAGAKKGASAEKVSFALGWFADSGEDTGEERLWLEEQMMVADGVKEKV